MTGSRAQVLSERINAMSLRERAMLMAIVLLLLWAAWHTLLMAPVSERRQAQALQVESERGQVTALNQAVQVLAVEAGRDPQAEARRQLEVLVAQQQEVDREVTQATSNLIAPRDMGAVLESILTQQRGLRLIGLHSIDPEPIDLGLRAAAVASATVADPGAIAPLYRHGMTIDVEGSYLDLLHFLQTLEALPWEFIWRELHIDSDHPRSRMRLTLYTMSLSEGWLGV